MKRILIGILAVFFALTVVAQAQDAAQPFAAVTGHSLSIYGLSAEPISVSNPDNRGIVSLAWSPDGAKLAYLLYDQNSQANLMVTDTTGTQPFKLDTGALESGFPITFTPDGNILFVGQGNVTNAGPDYRSTLQQIAPQAGAMPQSLGDFASMVGCGGGSPLPGDWGYADEAGFRGNYLTLQMTDFGILHSTSCIGTGIALFNPETGEDTPIGPDVIQQQDASKGYSRVVVSPDGKQLAALSSTSAEAARSLVVIDLATLKATDVQTSAQPDQLAWGRDGTIFYSVMTTTGDLAASLTANQKQKFGSGDTLTIPSNHVQIHHIDPTKANDQMIYETDAYAVGHMEATTDGTALMFSQVANMDAWVQAVADGTLNTANDPLGDAQRALVPVSLFQITLDGNAANRIGDNLSHFTLRPTTV